MFGNVEVSKVSGNVNHDQIRHDQMDDCQRLALSTDRLGFCCTVVAFNGTRLRIRTIFCHWKPGKTKGPSGQREKREIENATK